MAIDLMVMPLSRYWSGDYVTPAMELAWSLGSPYGVVGPGGVRTIPEGTPFGGPDAPARRRALAAEMPRRMASIGVASMRWREDDDARPFFARVDPASARSLLEDAARNVDREPGFFEKLRGIAPRRSHLAHASVLVPAELDAIAAHDGVTIGSLPRARAELEGIVFSPASDAALADWRAAIEEATRRRLPMILDT